jgi:AcrR family transcriptional regulator
MGYAKGAERRAEILRVALEVFTEGGYHGASTREIAARVGLSEAGLFHHFGSKQQLLAAVLEARDERDALDPADPLGSLVALVRRNADAPELVRLYAVTSAEATAPAHAAHDGFAARYARVCSQLADALGDPARARLVVAAMDGLQVQWLLDPSVDMAADLELL